MIVSTVSTAQEYAYAQEHNCDLAVSTDNETDVFMSGAKEDTPPRYVGYLVANLKGTSQLELARQFLTEAASQAIMSQLQEPVVELQCAGADGASIMCANHKIQLGQLGVIESVGSLVRTPTR